MTQLRNHRYSPLPLSETEETSPLRTSVRDFIRLNNLSFNRKKKARKKQFSNPYGNVYRKRRMSISCPSSPIAASFKSIPQLLTEVSERLEEEADETYNENTKGKEINLGF